jgi:hypothetical protein
VFIDILVSSFSKGYIYIMDLLVRELENGDTGILVFGIILVNWYYISKVFKSILYVSKYGVYS